MSDKKEDQLGQLYEAAQKLAETKGEEGEPFYTEIIAAVKGDKNVKTLAAQQLPKYFARFPKLQEQSLNAQIDLCEDESSIIRMYAINGLVETCKNSPVHRKQIADVLGQLLVAGTLLV
jgi:hypothetical protein